MDSGIFLSGCYLGSAQRVFNDKSRFVVAVAVGMSAYEVTMDTVSDFSKMPVGAPLLIRAEINLYKGKLYFQHGQVCARN